MIIGRFIHRLSLIGCVAVLTSVVGCAQSTDPIDLLARHYDEVVRIIKDTHADIKTRKILIEEYWNNHREELLTLQKAIEDEMTQAADDDAKEKFARQYEKILYKIKEVMNLLRENGIEL